MKDQLPQMLTTVNTNIDLGLGIVRQEISVRHYEHDEHGDCEKHHHGATLISAAIRQIAAGLFIATIMPRS